MDSEALIHSTAKNATWNSNSNKRDQRRRMPYQPESMTNTLTPTTEKLSTAICRNMDTGPLAMASCVGGGNAL